MQEIFYEESASVQCERSATRRYNIIKFFSILSYVIMGIWLYLSINFYGLTKIFLFDFLFITIPFAMFLISGILLGRLKNRFYVEFDYTFVSGDLRISKVIKNTKRKFMFKFDVKNIEKLGFYGSETYEKYEKMPGVSKHVLTSNTEASNNKDFYYIVANISSGKNLFVLECTETLIVNILKYTNKGILDEQFNEQLKNKNTQGKKWFI